MMNFHCPEFFFARTLYEKLLYIQEVHPEIFYENRKIAYLYGSFPNMIWNGGGCVYGCNNIDDVKRTYEYYKEKNMPIKLTFTNNLLTEKDCYDRYCNAVTKIFEDEDNEIIIASPILEEYLRNEYPKYKFNKSIINFTYSNDDYTKDIDKYHHIVIHRKYLKDFDYLYKIPDQYKSKIELLCNDPCPTECAHSPEHYKGYAEINLYERGINDGIKHCNQFAPNDECVRSFVHTEAQILPEEVDYYHQLGFTEFKLTGRPNVIHCICGAVYYLIKPPFQCYIISNLLNSCGSYNARM